MGSRYSGLVRRWFKTSSCKISPKIEMNFRDTYGPLLWMNRILGMSVIEIPEGRPWFILSTVFATGKWIGYGYLLWWYVVYDDNDESENLPLIMFVVVKTILFVNIVIGVLSTYMGLMHFKKRTLFFKKIQLADETLRVFGIDPEYSMEFKANLKLVGIWYLGNLFVISTNFPIIWSVVNSIFFDIGKVVVLQMPLLLNPVVELDFSIMIRTLGKRFERLNALIESAAVSPLHLNKARYFHQKYKNILDRSNSKNVQRINYYENRNNIELLLRTARQLHLDLCSTSREVNDVCSRQMSMQMAAKFLLITGFAYCVYISHSELDLPLYKKIPQFVFLGVTIGINIIRMIFVVRMSVNVTSEAHRTSQIAHEIQISKSQSNLNDEVHQLSLQIMQHPLFFTASGLLVLDFGYVRGFVGSVTTYLMILIQSQPDMLKAANTLADLSNDTSTSTLVS